MIPLTDEDMSMGLKSDLSEFWLNLHSMNFQHMKPFRVKWNSH